MGYDNTNRGVLFKNGKKREDKHPDYTGTINVRGEEFKLSAWIKVSAKGAKFMSLSVQQAQESAAPSAQEPHKAASADEGEDIPF